MGIGLGLSLFGFAALVLLAVTVWCFVSVLKDSGQMKYSESEWND